MSEIRTRNTAGGGRTPELGKRDFGTGSGTLEAASRVASAAANLENQVQAFLGAGPPPPLGDSQGDGGPIEGRPTSRYAREVAVSLRRFNAMFLEVHGRLPSTEIDGFEGTSLSGLLPVTDKFQRRFSALTAKVRLNGIKGALTPEQSAMLGSQASAATAPALLGLPARDNLFPNGAFQYVAQRRLLITNIGRYQCLDPCAASPKVCLGSSEQLVNVTDAHHEVCTSVAGGDVTKRHNRLRDVIKAMLKSVGVVVAIADATDDPTTRSLLERAGVARKSKAGGRYKGGDILIPRGLGEDPKPLVIDLTIVNERASTHLSHPWPAEFAEMHKRGEYGDMYDKIAYDFRGFGMEVGGRLGPEAEELIQLAQGLWWEANGKKALPAGANWTCPSFSSYWRQRMVGEVQRFNALMVRGRARRVAQLRVVRDLVS